MKKRDDKAHAYRRLGKANARAATPVNAVSAPLTPPVGYPEQLDLFPGRVLPLKAKPAMARGSPGRCLEGGSTRGQSIEITGETSRVPAAKVAAPTLFGREADKGNRNGEPDGARGVGGGHSTADVRDNRADGRAATSIKGTKRGKATGLRPQGSAPSRSSAARKTPQRMDKVRKLQRTLYRAAKQQPERRFSLLFDKVCRADILDEAWRRVAANNGSAGVANTDIAAVRTYGEARFLAEIQASLLDNTYRAAAVRRVRIPKPGQPGRTRPLGIPTVRDRWCRSR